VTKPYVDPYDPARLAAIRQARADLYAAQAERRRVYILTNVPAVPRQRAATDVQIARADLDTARRMAGEVGKPKDL
jgi:hypothetical protein